VALVAATASASRNGCCNKVNWVTIDPAVVHDTVCFVYHCFNTTAASFLCLSSGEHNTFREADAVAATSATEKNVFLLQSNSEFWAGVKIVGI